MKIMEYLKYLLRFLCILSSLTTISGSKCGYDLVTDSCERLKACIPGKQDMLNVHLIMHTHNDVGWVQTVDWYYDNWVRKIINSVKNSLSRKDSRRFIYVEMAYFSRWWDEQSEITKDTVRGLVNNGQLEFIGAGWSMADEATTHYLAIIDQMTLGLRWINDTFGECGKTKIGWQIDPFGHSHEHASLFAQMGMDGLFIGRLHYQDKLYREMNKNMEFVWRASSTPGEKSDIFTGILPNIYSPPDDFCFDAFCDDDELTMLNIDQKAHEFIEIAKAQSQIYATNNIPMTMGMDFYYTDAEKWYRNIDFLINYVNSLQSSGEKVNLLYSTPTCYLKSLHDANMTWTTVDNDFYPYASTSTAYWAGYFTSRPALKFHARRSNVFMQNCKQLVTIANVQNADLSTLRKALGTVQHHDAISGTSKQHVAEDYSRLLSQGVDQCEIGMKTAIESLLSSSLPDLDFCQSRNISQCNLTETENQFLVVAYNSLSQPVDYFIRLPVVGEAYAVSELKSGNSVPTQTVVIPLAVISLPERTSQAVQELLFQISIPPLGLSVYQVQTTSAEPDESTQSTLTPPVSNEDSFIENEYFRLIIDHTSGLVREIVIKQTGLTVPLKQNFYYYIGMPKDHQQDNPSGAYIFDPLDDIAYPLNQNLTFNVYKGPLVEEVHQYYTPWLTQVITLHKGRNFVGFNWVIGPISVEDGNGKEIITRFESDFQNNGVFYTDSNSRETLKRVRNYQETFPLNVTEAVAGNYYPVTSWIYMKDEQRNMMLSLLPDRAEGGSSIKDGSLELMIHRRLLFDDGYGVDEALNEPGTDGRGLIIRGGHHLTLGTIKEMASWNKLVTKKLYYGPLLTFSKVPENTKDFSLNEFSALNSALPPNVHVLTLDTLTDDTVLLRLEHFYESTDSSELSQPATLSLSDLFKPFTITSYRETTLAANEYLNDVHSLKWNTREGIEQTDDPLHHSEDLTQITLRPMEIRTFVLNINRV